MAITSVNSLFTLFDFQRSMNVRVLNKTMGTRLFRTIDTKGIVSEKPPLNLADRGFVVVSKKPEDHRFFTQLANSLGMECRVVLDRHRAQTEIISIAEPWIIWDIDARRDQAAHSWKFSANIEDVIRTHIGSARVFALSNQSVSNHPGLFINTPVFQYQIIRRYQESSLNLATEIFRMMGDNELNDSWNLIASGQIKLSTKDEQKEAFAAKFSEFCSAKNIGERIEAKLTEVYSELVANAIFNAPVTNRGIPLYKLDDRSKQRVLSDREQVKIEFFASEKWGCFRVSDQFGSVTKEAIQKVFGRDFRKTKLELQASGTGVGIGLYTILESGFSLIYNSQPGRKTEVSAFFLITPSMKELKEVMQFSGFFGGLQSKRTVSMAELV